MSPRDLWRHVAAIGRESWTLFVAISAANASNYIFHVVISRILGPDEYGALGAVLAVLIVISVPLGAVQTTVAKRVAEQRGTAHSTEPEENWAGMLRTMTGVGGAAAIGLAVLSPLMYGFLRLDSIWGALLVSLYVLPALALAVLRGVLQGRLMFKALAILSTCPVLLRLVVGYVVVRAGGGVAGAVGASVLAEAAGVLLALAFVGRPVGLRSASRDKSLLREVMPVAAGLAAMWLLIELDLVLARHFLAPEEAGNYAAAGLLARAVLFIPGAVSLVALPHFAQERGRGDEAFKWLMSSLVMVAGLAFPAAAVLALFSELSVDLTFGAGFPEASSLLPILALAMVGQSVVNLVLFFHIAAGSRGFHMLWPFAVLEAISIALIHASGTAIAWIVLLISWTVAGLSIVAARSVAQEPLPRLPGQLSIRPGRRQLDLRDAPDLSLVIPTFNGGSRLVTTVQQTIGALERLDRSFEVIVVSDGSTDGCASALVKTVGSVEVIHYAQRHGKGVALRVGMLRARGRYVAFIDGDGDLDPSEVSSFLGLMDLYDPDLIVGSKRHPLSTVSYPPTRRAMSWAYQRLVRVLFGLNIRDTQTGMKLVRRDVLEAALPRMLEKRFAFDLEFLVVARRLGYRRVFEAPVKLDFKFSSTVSPGATMRILLDTAAIYYRRFILRSYDHSRSYEHASAELAGDPEQSTSLVTLVEQGAGP